MGLSWGVYLCTGNHDFRSPGFDLLLGPITIGRDAWIAARAVLAPNTQIGPGAVVALGAVVSGTVPAGAIVRGNPAMRITSKGQVTIPQAIRERCGLLSHTSVQFREDNGRVVIEKANDSLSPGEDAIQRLRQARVRTRLSTEELLALTRGDEP